ncbi:MAG: hypothetical protein K8R92_03735 [Planctomycetes bacterium]|nr:hypothetical protein [Planctomycetota bacterium]
MTRCRISILLCLIACIAGCKKPKYDTSTPEAMLDAAAEMATKNRAEDLPMLLEIPARDITFDDGVTEASAIAEVKAKAGDMLARLLKVAADLRDRFPSQVEKEVGAILGKKGQASTRDLTVVAIADPAAWLVAQRARLTATDLGDGTASLSYDGQPIFSGALTLAETPEGWRIRFPVDLVRSSKYWPDTREEWAVLASMMLAVENALKDFESDLDRGEIRNLDAASSRVGRLVGESVVAQSIIYAMMKREGDDEEKPEAVPPAESPKKDQPSS